MIVRAIENWLTRTNERNYQAALCQVLMHQGHRVLHSSVHGPMEQGKDIITIGPDGECHAYQNKTGDIGLTEWRGISGEIQELVELPVDYPGVDKSKPHRAHLVTNGSITDPVRTQINDRNEDNVRKDRRYAPLEVIAGDSLLKSFVDAQGRFVPRELPDHPLRHAVERLDLFRQDLAHARQLVACEAFQRFQRELDLPVEP